MPGSVVPCLPWRPAAIAGALLFLVAACAQRESALDADTAVPVAPVYRVGPGDTLNVFVWQNPDLSTSVPVRPDGRISVPLAPEVETSGRTPAELAAELETRLSEYIREPRVTVTVTDFAGTFDQQVRVVGQAVEPMALQYRDGMTLLDAMIAVGGLTEFAAGNRTVLVRKTSAGEAKYGVRLDDLLRHGDVSANTQLMPGDILIIPESWF